MQDSRYLCSFHVPKTGGTTFAGHARRLLTAEEFVLHGPFARVDRFLGNQPQVEELPQEKKDKIKIVHGHGAGVALAEIVRGRFPEFMVVLRDPYARFVSGFHHFNGERKNSGLDPISEEKYYAMRSDNVFSTLLLKHFAPLASSQTEVSLNKLAPILQSFKYFLITERLDEQLPEICTRYGLRAKAIEARRIGKSKSQLNLSRGDFERQNRLDQMIYSTIAASAARPGAPIENPFGYKPDLVKNHLEEFWGKKSGESQLEDAYDRLVDALSRTLKLQAAFLKLTSGTVNHVADKELLLDRMNAALPQWLESLDDKKLSAAHFASGAMFVKEGRQDAAEQYFREAVRLNPTNKQALANLARVVRARGDKKKAATLTTQAGRKRPFIQTLRKVIGI